MCGRGGIRAYSIQHTLINMGKKSKRRRGGSGSAGGRSASGKRLKGGKCGGDGRMASGKGTGKHSGGSAANFAQVSMRQKNATAHERSRSRRQMRVKSLGRRVKLESSRLRRFVANPLPTKKRGYDPAMRGMALTGPARPAADLELSDHGCGLRVYECRDRCVRDEDKPEEVDLFKMYEAASEFWKHPACINFCGLLGELGDAYREIGKTQAAKEQYETALKLDGKDSKCIRRRLVAILMDSGDAAGARQEICIANSEQSRVEISPSARVMYTWTTALIEFISFYLLEEKGSSEELAGKALEGAVEVNLYVALILGVRSFFESSIDVEDTLSKLSEADDEILSDSSSFARALSYCIDQYGCWRDAGNAREYLWYQLCATFEGPEHKISARAAGVPRSLSALYDRMWEQLFHEKDVEANQEALAGEDSSEQHESTSDVEKISHLKVDVLSPGDGVTYPKKGDRVTVHYTGWLKSNGKKFDTSRRKGRNSKPFKFTVGIEQVIEGWDKGVLQMSLREKAMIEIPAALAYGREGAGKVIPPNADLVFEVQLLRIEGQ